MRMNLSRTQKLEPRAIKFMVVCGFFLSISVIALVFIGYLLTEMPLQRVEMLTTLKTIPIWTSLALIFMASLAAGVVEELAWRGYAQRTIELKHSAILAISIVALVFTIIHFLPLPVWPLFFLGSIAWGFLAYYSNSIIPGIIFHTIIDLSVFVWAMFNLEKLKSILLYNVFEDGINSFFLTLIFIAVVSLILTIFSLIKLKRTKAYNTK